MPQDQRDPGAGTGSGVHEVDNGAADPGPVVRESVQLPLCRLPVEALGPVFEQPGQPVPVGALRPRFPGRRLGQPGMADPGPQILDHRRINPDLERLGMKRRGLAPGHDPYPAAPRVSKACSIRSGSSGVPSFSTQVSTAVLAAARQAATVTLAWKLACGSRESTSRAWRMACWVASWPAHWRSRSAGVETMSLTCASRVSRSVS